MENGINKRKKKTLAFKKKDHFPASTLPGFSLVNTHPPQHDLLNHKKGKFIFFNIYLFFQGQQITYQTN